MSNEFTYDINEYVSKRSYSVAELSDTFCDTLYGLGKQYGTKTYRDLGWLQEQLIEKGVSQIEIYKLFIILFVPGFYRLIEQDRVLKVELNTFLANAYERTGLQKPLIMYIMSIVLDSLGIAFNISDIRSAFGTVTESGFAYIVPYEFYKNDVSKYKLKENRANVLNELVHMGVPKAKFKKGEEMLDSGNKDGLALINGAAISGDDEAARFLGRYYYNRGPAYWDEAYYNYARANSAVLDYSDRENLVGLFNGKEFNKRMLVIDAVIILISLIALLFIPSFGLYSGQKILGFFVCTGQIALLVKEIMKFKKRPYGEFYTTTAIIAAMWMLYMIIRVGF